MSEEFSAIVKVTVRLLIGDEVEKNKFEVTTITYGVDKTTPKLLKLAPARGSYKSQLRKDEINFDKGTNTALHSYTRTSWCRTTDVGATITRLRNSIELKLKEDRDIYQKRITASLILPSELQLDEIDHQQV